MRARWMGAGSAALMLLVSACGQQEETVTIPAQSALTVTLDQPVTTKYHQVGDRVEATVSEAVYVNDVLAIATGSTLRGRVTGAERAQGVDQPARLTIAFEELAGPAGETQRLTTQPLQMEGVPPVDVMTDAAEGGELAASEEELAASDEVAEAPDEETGSGPEDDSAELAVAEDGMSDDGAAGDAARPMLDEVGAVVGVIETRPYPTLVPATAENEIGLAPGQTLRLALAEPAELKAVPVEVGHADGG